MVRQLSTRVFAVSLSFLLISPFMPLDQAEGQMWEDSIGVIEFTEQNLENTLADVMTEDGFLLKPALNTTEGDRSGFSDIFAYTVKPGDTISSIASQFGLKKETILMENDLWNANRVRTGMTLNILPVDGISHLIKKNDTLDAIAKKYEVEKEVLMKQNQLEEGAELLADSRLIIPGGKKSISTPSYNSAPATAVASYSGPQTGRLLWPTSKGARLTQGFHNGHYALDIANRAKGPIYASAAGRVIKASYGWNGGYGNYVIIDHGNGMQTLYGHNEKLYVSTGQYVEAGQTIAWMGRSGRVYGPTGIHVHFEVRINGVKYNPMQFF